MRNPAAEVIVSAIGFLVCVFATIGVALAGHPAWSCVFAGAALAYAIVFAVARTELQEERRKASRQYVPRSPDFPEQAKHDIR